MAPLLFSDAPSPTDIYTLSLHDALPIYPAKSSLEFGFDQAGAQNKGKFTRFAVSFDFSPENPAAGRLEVTVEIDRKSTRLNSSHMSISYADFCLKKKICTDWILGSLLPS